MAKIVLDLHDCFNNIIPLIELSELFYFRA